MQRRQLIFALVLRSGRRRRCAERALRSSVSRRLRRWAHGRLPRSARGALDTHDLVQLTLTSVVRQIHSVRAQTRRRLSGSMSDRPCSIESGTRRAAASVAAHAGSTRFRPPRRSSRPSRSSSGGRRSNAPKSRWNGCVIRTAKPSSPHQNWVFHIRSCPRRWESRACRGSKMVRAGIGATRRGDGMSKALDDERLCRRRLDL